MVGAGLGFAEFAADGAESAPLEHEARSSPRQQMTRWDLAMGVSRGWIRREKLALARALRKPARGLC